MAQVCHVRFYLKFMIINLSANYHKILKLFMDNGEEPVVADLTIIDISLCM